jgi:hypothetical protein
MENWEGRPEWAHYKMKLLEWLSEQFGLRPAREAERFRFRLAADSLRRQTLDDAKRGAKRAALGYK